jgi:Fur family peroxide stress response transcriptional regulator
MIRNTKTREKSEVEAWCAGFAEICRKRGIRITDQRLAVYRALAEDVTHPTADSLYTRIRKRMPSMSQATLYRTLEFLESEKLIARVSAPQAVARFDANVEQHQHLVCRDCGTLRDISVPRLQATKLPKVADFKIEEMDIRFVGLCKDCARKTTRTRN